MRCVDVYLDQADWQHLKTSPFADALRCRASDGRIRLLISTAHLIETMGLDDGYTERLQLLAEFPGVYLIQETPIELMRRAAMFLTDPTRVDASDRGITAVRCTERHLTEACKALERYRRALQWQAEWEGRAHHVVGTTSAGDRQQRSRMLAAFVRGDADVFLAEVSKAPRGVRSETLIRVACKAMAAANRRPVLARHLGPFLVRVDDEFREGVLWLLPAEVLTSRAALTNVYRRWQSSGSMPSTACLRTHAAVCQVQYGERLRDLGAHMDRWHSVYAPWVGLFTADKRNTNPIKRALKGLTQTEVVRTHHLHDVVNAVDALGVSERDPR